MEGEYLHISQKIWFLQQSNFVLLYAVTLGRLLRFGIAIVSPI